MSAGAPHDWQRHRPWILPALALWGWQDGALTIALVLALLLELPRLVPTRLEIVQEDFNRLWSFTSVLFLAVIFYLALAREGLDAIGALSGAPAREDAPDSMHRISGSALAFLRWLPYILYPFTATVAWSHRTVLPWSTFSLYEQARAKRQPQVAPPEWALRMLHPGYLYVGVTLFAASTTTTHSTAFLPLLLTALLIALWPGRNRRWGAATWGVLLLVLGTVAALGNRGHQLTRDAWTAMEERLQLDTSGGTGGVSNPNQTSRTTSLGQIGTLKQSRAIILRITASDDAAPGLLREASFNRFHASTWDNGHHDFLAVELRTPSPHAATVTIARAGTGMDCPLAIPGDVSGVQPPRVGALEAGGLGSLRIHGGQPLVVYTAARGGGAESDGPPGADDLHLDQLTAHERSELAQRVTALAIDPHHPREAMARLARWFDTTFTYEIYQGPRADGLSPLLRFLTVTHAGHCEYFATATVLLLRSAGIPARYAVGYSVSEHDGGRWLARARDAHAWSLVWEGGRWVDFDTTPASWLEAEDVSASWLSGVRDLYDDCWYRFALWRQDGGRWQLVVFIAGMLVLSWIAWRQLRGSVWRRAGRGAPATAGMIVLGLDSEGSRLLARIAQVHGARLPHETVRSWLTRLRLLDAPGPLAPLREAVDLHLRLRFDPAGLDVTERQALRVLVARMEPSLAQAAR